MTNRTLRVLSLLVCGCGASSAGAPPPSSGETTTATPAATTPATEAPHDEGAAEAPATGWWTEPVPAEADADGLSADAQLAGRMDGATASLNGTALFPGASGITTLFTSEHPFHASVPEPEAQWRFTLRSGTNEAVLTVPPEAASGWMSGPPMLLVHETGMRWPALALVTVGRAASELRASFELGPRSPAARLPVVVTNAAPGEVVPVLFLRAEHARVDVIQNGHGPETTVSALRMHVRALERRRLVPGDNVLTLRYEPDGEAGEPVDEDGDGVDDPEEPPTLEALLVVGEARLPARVLLGADPGELTIPFRMP